MTLGTFIKDQTSARLFAALTIVSLLLSALPVAFFVAEAANIDAAGDVTVNVLAAPSVSNGEYFTISFTGTGTLNLTGWTVEDENSVRHTFAATSLSSGNVYKVCQDTGVATGCDVQMDSGASNVWDNTGDTLTLKDETSSTVLQVVISNPATPDFEYTNTTAVDYVPAMVNITNLAELQAAIENQADGQTWTIQAGDYGLDQSSTISANSQTGWYFPIVSNNITINGSGNPVIYGASYSSNGNHATQNLVTVFGDNVKITGLTLMPKVEPNKTLEVIGSDFTIEDVVFTPNTKVAESLYDGISNPQDREDSKEWGGSLYFSHEGNHTVKNVTINNGGVSFRYSPSGTNITFNNVNIINATNVDWINSYRFSSEFNSGGNSTTGLPQVIYHIDNTLNNATSALAGAQDEDIIELDSDIITAEELQVKTAVTINGNGYTITPNFISNGGNNSVLEVFNVDGVTISNLTIDSGVSNLKKLHGINVYESEDVLLNDVKLFNNGKSGLVVNSSKVTVSNITTAGNVWHGINVDEVTQPAALTINGVSNQTDTAHIYVDDRTEVVVVVDTENQYDIKDDVIQPNDRLYTLKVEPDLVSIEITKIVCDDESLLPDDNYSSIDENTAADFLVSSTAREAGCRLATADEFEFQWALGGVGTNDAPDNDGELGNPWQNPVATDSNGQALVSIPSDTLGNNTTLSVREVMDTNKYLPFSGTGGSNISAELYCHTDAANYDNLDWIKNVSTDNTYYCVAWNVEVPPPTTDVTICKYDTEENPLDDWTLMLLGNKIDTVEVPATSAAGVDTSNLVGGTSYVAIAAGTWDNNRGPLNIVDAEYSTENNWVDWIDGFASYPADILELFINDTSDPDSDWGEYNSAHRYAQSFVPSSDGPANFSVNDTNFGDNTGSLSVDVYEGYAGNTENGCVTFQDVPYGTYSVDEVMQDGWQNESGLGTVEITGEVTLDVVNLDISNVPTASIYATKVVCTDEEDLPNWNNGGGAPKITASTAADWVESHESCSLAPDWQFEWAPKSTSNPDSGLPTSALYGVAGGDWTTFGPTDSYGVATVELTDEDIDNDSYVWVREVLKDDYIPFTYGPSNLSNSDDATAEMYCYTDGLNYDNYDRVDGVSVGNDYHCVAWNSPVVKQCSLEIVSDTGTLVVDNNDYALEAYDGNTAWSANIADATWVWDSYYVADPTIDTTRTFRETFTVDNPSSALLDIAADNGYQVRVNGVIVPELDRLTQEVNYRDFTQKDDIDILSYLNPSSENTLEIEVKNFAQSGGNKMTNPAGVLYRLDVTGEDECGITTRPEEPVINPATHLISGYKYEVTDSGDVPYPGWTIYASNGVGTPLSTTTDSSGYYYFDVPAGGWEVYEATSTNWTQERVEQDESLIDADSCDFTFSGESSDEGTCDFYNSYSMPVVPLQTFSPGIYTLSGGSSGTQVLNRAPAAQRVLGASTSAVATCPFVIDYMQMGVSNNPLEVMKLQLFLNIFKSVYGGVENPVTGVFGPITDVNVKAFQNHYRSEILDPWFNLGIVPHNRPTGFVYKTTLWKINSIVCPEAVEKPSLEGEDLTENVDLD